MTQYDPSRQGVTPPPAATPSAEKARTWRDYCKHDGPCIVTGADRCSVPDDPAYIARMERVTPSAKGGDA